MNADRINTTLSREHHATLKALAAMRKISLSEIIDIAIEKYIIDHGEEISEYIKTIESAMKSIKK